MVNPMEEAKSAVMSTIGAKKPSWRKNETISRQGLVGGSRKARSNSAERGGFSSSWASSSPSSSDSVLMLVVTSNSSSDCGPKTRTKTAPVKYNCSEPSSGEGG